MVPSSPNSPNPHSTEIGLWLRQVNAFVGRSGDLEALDGLLPQRGPALVTLFGAAGVGKTRLCAQWLATRGRPALICELEHAQTAQHIWAHLGEALGLRQPDDGQGDVNALILEALSNTEPSVILMDNFEHLIQHGAVLRLWLERAPQHCVVVCSRRRLGQRQERCYELTGLADDDGVALFEHRAQELLGHPLDGEQRPATRTLVQRLEGNPLAIELAASQVLLSSPEQILANLEREVLDMTNAWEDVPVRQRSLRDAMVSTWTALDEDGQRLWALLSGYDGAFALRDLPRPDPAFGRPLPALLLQLRNHCLVRPLSNVGSVPLFKLNAVARHFGRERLSQPPPGFEEGILKAATEALGAALLSEDPPQRAAFSARIPDLARLGRQTSAPLALEAATLLQRARRCLRVLGRDDDTAQDDLQRLMTLDDDPRRLLRAEVEVLWGQVPLGTLDTGRLEQVGQRAAQMGALGAQGSLALLEAHWASRDVRLEHARACAQRAVGFFERAGDEIQAARALIDELRFAMHLHLAGVLIDLDAVEAQMVKAGALCARLGTDFYHEKYEQLRALLAFCHQDVMAAYRAIERGLKRTAEHQRGPVWLHWRHYRHSFLIRTDQHKDAIELGWTLLGESKRQGVLVETLLLEQSMTLAATGNFAAALELVDDERNPQTMGSFALGPFAVLQSLGALEAGRLDSAHRFCRQAIDLFTQTDARTRLSFALGLQGMLWARQGQGAKANACMAQARRCLVTFDPEQRTSRARALDCVALLIDPMDEDERAERLRQLRPAASLGLTSMMAWAMVDKLLSAPSVSAAASPVDARLKLDLDGAWFEVPGQARVDLSGRTALRRLLAEFVRRHKEGLHQGLDMYALMEIGWPDEVLTVDNGPGRVRAAIHTLRSLGLRGVLVNNAGYLIKKDASVSIVNP